MTSENTLTLQIHLEFPDVLHANRLYRASTSADYAGRPILGVISLLIGGFYLAHLLTQPLDALNDSIWSFVIAIILLFMGLVFIFDLIPTLFLWLASRRNRKRNSQTHQTIFDEHGIAVHQQNADAQYKWGFFEAVVEGRREFILIYGVNLYFVIPKKAFQNDEEIEFFKSMLKSNLVIFKQKLKIPLDFQM
jgi:hypothetical protein